MGAKGTTILKRIRTESSRVLAFVLLAGLFYSASFGTVHSHFNTSRSFYAGTSTSHTGPASVSSELPIRGNADTDGCLICVLRQQLFSSTVGVPYFVERPPTEVLAVSTETPHFRSDPIITSTIVRFSGRAPPIA
jgi:hypothetical protein